MDKIDLLKLKDELHQLVKEVGAYQLKNLGRRDLIFESKTSAVDIVTEVDKESEKRIISFIKKRFPDHAILAEESGSHETQSNYMWIIDPVDGTTNYAHGYPIFCIAIGLQLQGKNILGCVYAPYVDEFFWAIKDEGAYCNDNQITVSHNNTLKKSILATGFPYNKAETSNNNLNYFNHMMPQLAGIRRSGSACFDMISVACGRIDGYFEMYLNQWDFEPGKLILEEAGGRCTSKPLRERYSVIATNGRIHDILAIELHKVGTQDYK